MDENMIVTVGQALWGSRWQTDMAKALGVNDRTVRSWEQGRCHPRPGIYVDLMRMCLERAQDLDALAEKLKSAGA
ncbi:MAG: hypothetical protein J0626_03560 [Rhodospirillaceae bacterium]|nr:hypothetical protein [Rhodospirillaceae bacterium]